MIGRPEQFGASRRIVPFGGMSRQDRPPAKPRHRNLKELIQRDCLSRHADFPNADYVERKFFMLSRLLNKSDENRDRKGYSLVELRECLDKRS